MNLSTQHKSEILLGVLFIIYLVLGLQTPEPLANLFVTIPGKVVLLLFVGLMFWKNHPILAILGLLVVFDLIRRSSIATGLDALQRYAPSEAKKSSQFTAFNQFPYTLEQEMVKKMTPNVGTSTTRSSFKPEIEDNHNASPLN